jgi:ribonucleoside-diphosphate reductase alpha chain
VETRCKGYCKAGEEKSAQIKWEKEFYTVLKDFKFVPAGRILSGAGTEFDVTYFNCFVIPTPHDSRGEFLKHLINLLKSRHVQGGVGLNLSSLRPRGARVRTVNGFSSGPVVWAGLYSYATHDVVQQGGSRRGATMLMLWDWHPDIEEFITVKEDLTKIHGANLSVCISDAFMEAVKKDADWDLVFPDQSDPMYDTKWDGEIETWRELGGKVTVHKTMKARELWDLICTAAWKSAEPGLHFLDRSNKRSNTWYFEKLVATNPCGEQPLGPWAVCNLGAMNLSQYVKRGKFDFDEFGRDVKTAMRFLDNVIDDTFYFFDENEKSAKDIRRTGLGIMGIADALIKMKIRYGSDESIPVVRKMFETLRNKAYEASIELAEEKGSFPKFEREKFLQGWHIQKLPKKLQHGIKEHGIRNGVLLTVAPTGTTSVLAETSSGIEPIYEFEYRQTWRGGQDMVYHHLYKEWKEKNPDKERPEYFVSANDLTPKEHVLIQAIAQEYIDASISKTVNAPNDHTIEKVKELYESAYDLGLKGITYMREGSRQGVLERVNTEEKKEETAAVETQPTQDAPPASPPLQAPPAGPAHKIIPRPTVTFGSTHKVDTPVGTAYVTINEDESGEPFEVFINGVGKAGSDLFAMAEGLGRMISLNLRVNSHMSGQEKVKKIVDELLNIGGAGVRGFGKSQIRSLPDAVAKVLSMKYGLHGFEKMPTQTQMFIETQPAHDEAEYGEEKKANGNGHAGNDVVIALNGNGKAVSDDDEDEEDVDGVVLSVMPKMMRIDEAEEKDYKNRQYDICSECGEAAMIYEEGCNKCYNCGFSKC